GSAPHRPIHSEAPASSLRPDTGGISAYRAAGGAGVRLDGGTAYAGAEGSAHFDSMLVKCTTRGRTFEQAVDRARRALAEFRIRGVASNIGFLRAVLAEPQFRSGDVATTFIDDHPHLLDARVGADRGSKILEFLADTTVNRPHGEAPVSLDPSDKLPALDAGETEQEAPAGSRQK